MSKAKNVSTSEVREWLSANGITVGKRGRLTSEQVAAFHKGNKGKRYEAGSDADKPTITVPVKVTDRIGRATTKKVTLTTAEARKVLGQPTSRRGRFNKSALAEALSAQYAAAPSDES